jgi:SAM-dependent methyltransferase
VSSEGSKNRWQNSQVLRGAAYDDRFERLAASGHDVHGEARLVESLGPRRVLDAGCGTGRVAIELASRGLQVTGVDVDDAMLAEARRKAPHLSWITGNLATVRLDERFDLAVLAGNVMIFVASDERALVVANMAAHLLPGGLLIAGFTLERQGLTPVGYDELAAQAGLTLVSRWSTWDRQPFEMSDRYAVSVHRAAGTEHTVPAAGTEHTVPAAGTEHTVPASDIAP